MKELINGVEKLVNAECARAQEKYGRGYASDHEAWAVMGEEVMEAELEFETVKDLHSDMQVDIWRHNKLRLMEIMIAATRCACEMIQVAAVARKMMEGEKASYLEGAICPATKLPCIECVPGAPCSVKEKKDDQHTELQKEGKTLTINEFLQKWRWVAYGMNVTRPRVRCADGYTVLVQAGRGMYSRPAADADSYTHVELGYPSMVDDEIMPYSESAPWGGQGGVYAGVPVELVDAVLDKHGGITGEDWTNNTKELWEVNDK